MADVRVKLTSHTRQLNALQQDMRMVRSAINDMARVQPLYTSGGCHRGLGGSLRLSLSAPAKQTRNAETSSEERQGGREGCFRRNDTHLIDRHIL